MLISTLSNLVDTPFKNFFKEKNFHAGELLFRQSDPVDGCHLILKGSVHGFVRDHKLERQATLNVDFGAQDIVGIKDLIENQNRNFSAITSGNVRTFFLSKKSFHQMQNNERAISLFYKIALNSLCKQTRLLDEHMASAALMNSSIPEVNFTVSNAVLAHHEIGVFSEQWIDQLINDVAIEINKNANTLATQTVLESNMGIQQHKILKIGLGSIEVAKTLIGKEGVGSIGKIKNGVRSINSSMGVVFGMIPITNPVETIVFKFLSCLKSRNAIIISSHRKGRDVGLKTVQIIQALLKKHGAPINLIQASSLPANRIVTNAFMSHKDVNFILATGGPSMVKSAYSSGTPAIGVGRGNAPVWVCEGCDILQATQQIINSKSFDNGIVCGSENNLLVDATILDEFVTCAKNHGAIILNDVELQLLHEELFSRGRLDSFWVGRSAEDICKHLNIQRDNNIKLILARVEKDNLNSPLLKEKLAPILSLSVIDNTQQALTLAKNILKREGAGHTAIIHCKDNALIEQYSQAVDVNRILVNTSGTQGCIGTTNGLELSWTLGCGTQGGGSTSDNVNYRHLMNVKRIAYAQ
ncbi:Alcohol dehydrogenase; Acetaldehyde dehydrogenase [hydrothermal vent metagenome]|uniref:Alcohol dehydrogenase Acetaldehyde dehydrogenase n=1 Tax=hydrothermal vent metagenome TaxID=652676 RepID=A0A3B0Z833_9ZZZZ